MWDNYFQDTYLFEIMGFEVAVADELLAEALKALPQDSITPQEERPADTTKNHGGL